jgi:hypothetical protein
MAAGSYGDIAVVVSDADLIPGVRSFLPRLNQPVSFVIKTEPPYNIDIFEPRKWHVGRNYKNILFVIDWTDKGPVHKEIVKLLSDKTEQEAQSGQEILTQFKNPYARYQFAALAIASDRNSVISLINRKVDHIRDLLEDQTRQRIVDRFRHEGVRSDLQNHYWRSYGFSLEIPQVYHQNQAEPEGFPGIEWMRTGPSRGITLAWISSDEPENLLTDDAELLALRRRMGAVMHDEDLVEVSLGWSDTTLAGIPCRKLTGAWAGRKFRGGGPFWSYFLSDPERQRVYCLDLLVFAPDQEKMAYFREMAAVASTFSLEPPPPQ